MIDYFDGVRWVEELAKVQKHGTGDQKPHGSWADGAVGGNGLDHRGVYNLQHENSDPLKIKVYDAEEKYSPTVQRELTKPFPPNNRNEYATKEEYDKVYKEYSKNWDKWSRETSRNIQSSTGEKHLDGTVKGIQNYINEVTNTDWFKKTFGDGGVIKTPKVSLTASAAAGSYQIGFKRGVPFSGMYINKGFSLNEPVILHELAHYATTISTTKPFSAHGIEFATNHLYLTNKAVGSSFANGLRAAYKAEGVPLGN
jgi:putative metallohydrolase (TIGR04338 family)